MATPNSKIIAFSDIRSLADDLRAQRRTIALTNGVFDIVHIGHLRYLQQAKTLADVLIVGINSDVSTHALKGPLRPYIPEMERAELLAGFACVDYTVIFPETTAIELLWSCRPNVYVKGGDYAVPAETATPQKILPEAEIAQTLGARIELISYVEGHSTSDIIQKIIAAQNIPPTK